MTTVSNTSLNTATVPVPVTSGGTGLATMTNAYSVVCSGSSATSMLAPLNSLGSSGQVLTSNGVSAYPSWQAASGGGFTWNAASGTTQAATAGNGYICTNSSVCTVTLPATAPVGSVVSVQGEGSTSGWILAPNSGQSIQVGQTNGTTSVTAAAKYDSISVVCVVANTTWAVTSVLSSGVTVV